jgi:hypothetical protein
MTIQMSSRYPTKHKLRATRDTYNSSRCILYSSLLYGTHHFLQKNNKECSTGTRDFLVGTH